MPLANLSNVENEQDINLVKQAAQYGPVILMNMGKPAHVLMTIEEYHRISAGHNKIADLLAMSELVDIELEIPARNDLARSAEL